MADFNLDLDLAKQPDVAQVVRVRKGDFGSTKIIADVYHNGAPADLNGLDARFECRRKDGTKIIDGSATIDGNTVTYLLPVELGTHKELIKTAYFAILNGGVWRDTTEVFFLDVQDSAVEGIVPGDYIPEIDAKIALLNAYLSIAGESEAQRVENEDARIEAEAERVSNETARVSNEDSRIEAEEGRITAESERDSAETIRVSNEAERVTAEDERTSSESERAQAEVVRIQSELYREATFAEMIASWQGLSTRILQAGEYDENGKPTIAGASGIIYLVPKDSAHPEDGYYEWIYISSGWERIGSTDTTITAIATDQIDSITNDVSVLGDEVLSTTGLTYLWGKIKAKFASLVHTHNGEDIYDATISRDKIDADFEADIKANEDAWDSIYRDTRKTITGRLSIELTANTKVLTTVELPEPFETTPRYSVTYLGNYPEQVSLSAASPMADRFVIVAQCTVARTIAVDWTAVEARE